MQNIKASNFSVISSILSPKDIALFVHEKYALSAYVTCKLLKAGINHTYLIEDESKKFIFRIYSYNWRTKEEINEELNLLVFLKQNNISISYPIVDISDNFIQTLDAPEGERYAVLFSYASGEKMLNYSQETHFEIGKLMAQIHVLTRNKQQKRMIYTSDILLKNSLQSIRKFLSDETKEMDFLMKTALLLEKKIAAFEEYNLRRGIVHLDIWFDNLNISDKNQITLFDFDFCGNGWLCLDIAYYVLQLHSIEKNDNERAEKLKAFFTDMKR